MSKLLDPKIIMAIKNLNLAAKMTIDGFMSGINKSITKGNGLEFSQYRSYQPGDDLRSLDWKMYARSDRYYIRESVIDTNINVRIVVDASASMAHSNGQYTKMEYAQYLGACLAYLCNLQSDAIGLYVFNQTGIYAMSAKQDFQHLSRLYHQLESIKPEGEFTNPIHLKSLFSNSHKRELVIFISDLYQKGEEIYKTLDAFASLRHEIMVFHLLANNEINLNFKDYNTFEDLETGQSIQIDQSKARTIYKENFNKYLADTKATLLNKGIAYEQMTIDEPIDQALRNFLKQRNK